MELLMAISEKVHSRAHDSRRPFRGRRPLSVRPALPLIKRKTDWDDQVAES